MLIDTHDFLRDETRVTVEADVARLQAWFREVYASSCRANVGYPPGTLILFTPEP